MGKITRVKSIPGEKPPKRTAEELAEQVRIMEEDPDYFDEIPVATTEEFTNGNWFGPEERQARYAAALTEREAGQQRVENVTFKIPARDAAFLRSRGDAFRARLSSIIQMQIAEARQAEERHD